MRISGGFGTVHLHSELAEKEYTNSDPQNAFIAAIKEIACMHAMHHPCISRILCVSGTDVGKLRIFAPLFEGTLACCYPSAPPGAVMRRISCALWKAVHFMHRNGMWHRDIKRGNVLVRRAASSAPHVVLHDFNTAGLYIEGRLHTLLPTTHNYAAPEMLLGSQTYDRSVDVWSLGVTLMEVQSEKYLFLAEPPEQVAKRVFDTFGWPAGEGVYASLDEAAVQRASARGEYYPLFPTSPKASSFVKGALNIHPERRCNLCDFTSSTAGKVTLPCTDWKDAWDSAPHLSEHHRSVVVKWYSELSDTHSAKMAVSLLDAYVEATPTLTTTTLQCAATACFSIASSLIDTQTVTWEEFAKCEAFSEEQLKTTMLSVLQSVGYLCYRKWD